MQIPPFTLERQYQEIGSEIEKAVMKVLQGGQYIGGQEIAEFEGNFASFIGVNHVAVSYTHLTLPTILRV